MTRVEVTVQTALALLGAILIATYILFGGPSSNDGMPKRKKRKKGFVPGLINLGNTCFLNCILQSLASCSSFTSWVDHHTLHRAPPILLAALQKLLNALNNDAEENFTSAEEVLRALRSHGWVIAPEEQDAHELFHALTSTLDDEVLLIREQSNSLLNVSWVSECLNNSTTFKSDKTISLIKETKDKPPKLQLINKCSNYVIVDNKELINSSNELSMFEDFAELDSEELFTLDKYKMSISSGKHENFIETNSFAVKNNQSEILDELGSVKDICQDQDIINYTESENEITKFDEKNSDQVSIGLTKVLREMEDNVDARTKNNLSIISKVPSLLNQEEGPSLNDTHNIMESPFKGHLASKMQCIVCGFKNTEQWSTFKSLSLFMPNDFPWGHERCTLHDLLDAFVRPERVAEVTCEGCTKVKNMPSQTTFTKQLTIGKLPECLCFHIQRTVWLENNQAIKRKEYVAFPVKINMEPYTYTVSLNQHVPEVLKEGGLLGGREPFHDYLKFTKERPVLSKNRPTSFDQDKIMGTLQPNLNLCETLLTYTKTVPACDMPNRFIIKGNGMYTLKAVVVHVGDIFSGHFVTYRKGPADTSIKDKWFFTSDATVREVSLDEVLRSSAYMILYERLNF